MAQSDPTRLTTVTQAALIDDPEFLRELVQQALQTRGTFWVRSGERGLPGLSQLPGQPPAAHPDDEWDRASESGTQAPDPGVHIFPNRDAYLGLVTALVAEISAT